MKTCPRCGVENKPEKAACWNCWAPLDAAAGGAAQPAPARRRLSLAIPWTMVAVVLLVIIAAAGVYMFLLASKPAQVAEDYLSAVRNGNTEKRDRLATRETSGQTLLPEPLLIGTQPQVQAENVQVTDGQAEVPVVVQLTVDPIKIGVERAPLIDAVLQFLRAHPVRADLVLAKQGLSWRVDQAQSRRRLLEAAFKGAGPDIAPKLAAAGLPVAESAPPPAPAPAPSSPPASPAPPAPGAVAPPAKPGA